MLTVAVSPRVRGTIGFLDSTNASMVDRPGPSNKCDDGHLASGTRLVADGEAALDEAGQLRLVDEGDGGVLH
jgi:hypothetical protein